MSVKESHSSDSTNDLLNSIIDNIPVAIFMKDQEDDFKFTRWNKAAENLWGMKASQVLGKNDFDFFPEIEAERFRAKDKEVMESGRFSLIDEESITLPTGEVRYLRTKKTPVLGRYLLGVSEDITSLRESQMRLRLALNSIQMGVWDWDLVTNAIIWDDSMYELFQIDARDFTGTIDAWTHCIHPEDSENVISEIQLAHLGKKAFDTKFRIITKAGEVRHIAAKAKVERDGNGRPTRMLGVDWDVTDFYEAQEKMIHSSKLSSLGEMAGGIAHEVNNPLAIIQAKTGFIKKKIEHGKLDHENLIGDLTTIENTVERIAKIIRGLRAFSRNSESDPMVLTPVALLISDTLELCKERFKNNSIRLEIECHDGFFIQCRATEISQVLLNLLSNAFDAVSILSEKWVRIEAAESGKKVRITVTDSGTGIPRKIVDKIMQPFFTTKEVGKGTGLGLSISKGITENHGGQLLYDAATKNTRFTIELPLAKNESRGDSPA